MYAKGKGVDAHCDSQCPFVDSKGLHLAVSALKVVQKCVKKIKRRSGVGVGLPTGQYDVIHLRRTDV